MPGEAPTSLATSQIRHNIISDTGRLFGTYSCLLRLYMTKYADMFKIFQAFGTEIPKTFLTESPLSHLKNMQSHNREKV